MRRTRQFTVVILLLALASCAVQKGGQQAPGRLQISDFASGTLQNWQQQTFKGKTQYRITELDGDSVLQADTRGTASALYKELDIDLARTPYLNWAWRVDNIYHIDDPLVKSGDDYPARLYVVVKLSPFPWDTLALNYVWCNQPTDLAAWKNPFSKNSVMIPVRCGSDGLGEWHRQQVNVAADFEHHFGRQIDTAHGVAIMSDSDNANGAARAYYRGIYFSGE